uniref:Uncharacterized protein n=1 Tax=Anguilla anguilla TaxID=7936 RepID=A0A0E9VSA8_ANGAN
MLVHFVRCKSCWVTLYFMSGPACKRDFNLNGVFLVK